MLFRFAFVALLVLQVAVASYRTVVDVDDDRFYIFFDRIRCVENVKDVVKDYNELVAKYVTDLHSKIEKEITPVVEEFAKKCVGRFPELKKPATFAIKVANYCGLVRTYPMREQETAQKTCGVINMMSPVLYQAKERNSRIFKDCNAKETFEKAWGPMMTDC